MALPYQGNKSAIANDLILFLRYSFPDVVNFYDLFGGGGNISERARKHFIRTYYNELNTSVYLAFKSLLDGSFSDHLPKEEFITGEKFFEIKSGEDSARKGLVLTCWSFGNCLDSYLYGSDLENFKQALHNICFTDSEEKIIESLKIMSERVFNLNGIEYTIEYDLTKAKLLLNTPKMERRFKIRNCVLNRSIDSEYLEKINLEHRKEELYRFEDLKKIESLQRLQRLQRLENIECYNFDYKDFYIKENSLVYCDIPYNSDKSKGSYGIQFNHEEFYNWAKKQTQPVVFSEYLENVPPDFEVIWSKSKINLLAGGKHQKKSIEVLAWNKVGKINKHTLF